MRKAPRRGLRLAKFQFLLFLLVCFLLPDVIADDLFRHTDGADAVPACPKVVAREVGAAAPDTPDECGSPTSLSRTPPCSPHSTSVEYPTRHARDPTARALPPTPRRAADTTPERFSQPHVASRRRSRVSDTSAPTPRDVCNTIGRGIGLCHSRMTVSLLNWGVHVWRPSHILRPTPTTVEPLARLTARGGGLPI